MTTFKDMLTNITSEVIAEMQGTEVLETSIESRNYHSAIDRWCESHNDISEMQTENFKRSVASTKDMVLNSASYTDNDKFYSSSKSEMYRERRLERKWNNQDAYWSYLENCMKMDNSAPTVDSKDKAVVKKMRSIPKASYLPSTPKASCKDYKPSLASTKAYTVEDYHFYKQAIVLDLIDADKVHDAIQNRELPEKNPEIIHLVFRYAPLTRTGKHNPYDGITQLRNFLHSQKFITSQKPATVKDALNILVGYTVDFPQFFSYNNTSKADNLTVYSVFGDFSDFDIEFSK